MPLAKGGQSRPGRRRSTITAPAVMSFATWKLAALTVKDSKMAGMTERGRPGAPQEGRD
jgi:hypothetical protein